MSANFSKFNFFEKLNYEAQVNRKWVGSGMQGRRALVSNRSLILHGSCVRIFENVLPSEMQPNFPIFEDDLVTHCQTPIVIIDRWLFQSG